MAINENSRYVLKFNWPRVLVQENVACLDRKENMDQSSLMASATNGDNVVFFSRSLLGSVAKSGAGKVAGILTSLRVYDSHPNSDNEVSRSFSRFESPSSSSAIERDEKNRRPNYSVLVIVFHEKTGTKSRNVFVPYPETINDCTFFSSSN